MDDLVLLKDGSCTLVIQVTAINFGLLSESEQDAIIYAYAGLLNSLTFPIQIIIRSIGKDISDYLRLVREQEHKLKKPLLLEQLVNYRRFIENTVKDNQILDKKFYVAIPFGVVELGLTTSVTDSFKKKKKLPYPKPYILEKAKMSLYPKRDHLIRQFGRIGLQTRQLNTQQLMELFYNLYNLESEGQRFVSSREYANPIVQPAIGRTNPAQITNPFTMQAPSVPQVGTSTPFPNSSINPRPTLITTPMYQPTPAPPIPIVPHNPAPMAPQPSGQPIARASMPPSTVNPAVIYPQPPRAPVPSPAPATQASPILTTTPPPIFSPPNPSSASVASAFIPTSPIAPSQTPKANTTEADQAFGYHSE